MKTWALLLGMLAVAGSTFAQTVYRCGPDGRTYSQSPCPAGKAVDVSDMRSDAQRRDAAQVTRQQEALGRSMEDERLGRESRPAATAATLGQAVQAPPAGASSATRGSKKKKPRRQANEAESRAVAAVPKPRKPAKPKN